MMEFEILGLMWQGWLTLGILIVMIITLLKEWFSPDVTLASALGILLLFGVLTPSQALAGFSNHGLLTIGALFVVAQGVQESGGMAQSAFRILGKGSGLMGAYVRMILPITAISAFLNNTPVVAMFVPPVRTWAIRNGISPSKLLIPLSYASILGGMCTLIGTSTNLVVSGMMVDHGAQSIGMFEITKVGLPAAVIGVLFLFLFARRLLPDRMDITDQLAGETREYLVEMVVRENCALVGQSVEEGGLRHLKGLFLVHVEREGKKVGPVAPNFVLRAKDRLMFTGLVSTIVDLKSIRGLVPVEEAVLDLPRNSAGGELRLFEVVVATGSPLVGQGIRQAGFRNRYEAAVIAVHRAGQRIVSKIGDIVLKPGDTLMIEAPEAFSRRWYNSTHFYLVSRVGDIKRVNYEKAPYVLVVLAVMIALPALGIIPMIVSAFGAAALLVVTKVISPLSARGSINLSILVVIGCALGLGKALEITGLANILASFVINGVAGLGPIAVLLAIMLLTNVFTELVTNKAAAAVFFPVAISAAEQLGYGADSPQMRAFQIAIALSAAASFATPLGYQTNLIVYGPGGYKFKDFIKVGSMMNLLIIGVGALAFWYWFF